MSEKRASTDVSFLKLAGGAVAVAGTVDVGREGAAPRGGRRGTGDPGPLPGGHRRLDLPAAHPGDPAVPPGRPGAGSVHDLHLRVPQPHRADDATQRSNQKNKAQHSAPLFWVEPVRPGRPEVDFNVQLTNLGLALRPDLFDAHTLHWHGFRNVIPFFDGEPTGSVAVPTGRDFTYVYRPRDPGTYMYHCHVEDVEHVHMGMNGLVFVRPLQDGNTTLYPSGKYMYNDGDGSTGFDREFAMFLSEVWAESHWADAHIQLPEWSDYRADFSLLNGRVYPDTLAPNGSIDPFNPVRDANGDLIAASRTPRAPVPAALLAGQLQRGRAGGPALRQPGLPRAGDDAGRHPDARRRSRRHPDARARRHRHLVRDRHDQHRPRRELRRDLHGARRSSGSGYDTYMLYNRNYTRSNNLAPGGFGGQATEIRVYASGRRPAGLPERLGDLTS